MDQIGLEKHNYDSIEEITGTFFLYVINCFSLYDLHCQMQKGVCAILVDEPVHATLGLRRRNIYTRVEVILLSCDI